MSDPNGWVSQPPSTIVKVVNTSREALNGQLCVVLAYQNDRGRYVVIVTGASQEQVSLKPENLVKASWLEQFQAQYQLMQNNPQVQQQLRSMYTKVQGLTGMKPEYVGMAALVLLVVGVYFLGFNRTLLLLSSVMLVVITILPDLQAGANPQQILRNAPMRFRAIIRENVPVVGDRIASSSVLSGLVAAVLVFFLVNALVGGGGSRGRSGAPPPPPMMTTTGALPPKPLMDRALLEDYYQRGFEDGQAGLEFGTSLPVATPQGVDTASSSSTTTAGSEYSWPGSDYIPPPPKGPSILSKLMNWSSLFSLYVVGSTVYTAGRTVEGTWDPQLCVVNLRMLDPWKMGMLALSVYRLVSPLLSS
jgi:hypothetical protein